MRRPLFSFDESAFSGDLFNWVIVLAMLCFLRLALNGHVQNFFTNDMSLVWRRDVDGES